jgi:hypothetical protein
MQSLLFSCCELLQLWQSQNISLTAVKLGKKGRSLVSMPDYIVVCECFNITGPSGFSQCDWHGMLTLLSSVVVQYGKPQ